MFSANACGWIAVIAAFVLFGIIVRKSICEIRLLHKDARFCGAERIKRELVQKFACKRREERRREKRGER